MTAPVLPTPSPSPTTEPSQDATTPPDRPAAMATPDADGAAAAAAYFIALYPYVYATGDLTEWRALADPACEFCNSVAGEVEVLHSRGHRVDTPLTVVSSKGLELDPDRWFSAEVAVVLAESREVDANGTTVSTDAGGSYRTTFALTWADGWRIDAVGLQPNDQ
ncbi:hypothetical protein J1G42_02950 [Cellulomonas sp. zg-ZUI222]|uniref:DUF6318 family protein n=1 Tax=Cellulomonas wangleii TaxID=2816956 RepID=UPI001A94BE70|nr:DUF6318 family protein [Cellulomonas wangleii]MBO0919783.1 hypothetical protein [Cellulomonas wangleii]